MERSIIFRDLYETRGTDFANSQTWTRDSLAHLVTDAITGERQFVGLAVTVRSASEIEIAPGRLYNGQSGQRYALATAQVVSVFSMLPLQDQKWIAISVYGQEEETSTQPRDYLLNIETGQTEPRMPAMEQRWIVMSHIAQGLESPTPERPEPPTGYTLIAHVRLSPSGIQEVVLATSRNLPNLHNVNARVQHLEGWELTTKTAISSIKTDMAALGEAIAARATVEHMVQLGMDMARLKERAEIPDDYKNYGADHFLNEDESDIGAVGYSALVREGIRPPIAATATTALSLANPLDPAATVSADGFCLPAYTEVTRLRLENRLGDVRINQYEYQTQTFTQKTMPPMRIRYGETRTPCTNSTWWKSGIYDPTSGILRVDGQTWIVDEADRQRALVNHQFVRVQHFWQDNHQESYWDAVTTSHVVNGSILAQTLLMHQTGWLTSVSLHFTNVDPAAGLTLLLCEVVRGQPDVDGAIARREFAANALSAGWCKLTFARPVFVDAGRRYAIVIASGAAHKVAYTSGTEYTQGVLMHAQSDTWFTEDGSRDLCLRLQFAQFISPRAVLQMNSLELAGGIADIDLLYESIVPDGCELTWEYQVAGFWYPIQPGTAANLAALPNLIQFRAICVGTTDLMPGFKLPDSQVIVSRSATAFTHFSTTRLIGVPSDKVIVRLLLEDFNPTYHTVDCDLMIAGSPVNATSYKDEIVDARSRWREYLFELGATITEFAIKATGSTTDWRKAWHIAERYDIEV